MAAASMSHNESSSEPSPVQVFMLAAISADGFIAPASEGGSQTISTSWTSTEDRHHFWNFSKAIGTVIMGRKTYDTVGKPFPKRVNIVLTSDQERQPRLAQAQTLEPGQAYFTSDEPAQILEQLAARGRTQAVLAGGASVYGAFWQAGLVDELYLTIEPIIFGRGVRLLGNAALTQPSQLQLLDQKDLNEQSKMLHYRVQH